jgi:glutaredoxin
MHAMRFFFYRLASLCAFALAAGAGFPSQTQAQQVYRIVGPDGKITFSDKPPPLAGSAKAPAAGNAAATGGASTGLPYELRQTASRYPVTLYTGDNCGPCASARSMLITRGVPFAERSVTSNEDIQALQRLSGENSLPFATVGSQQLKGYSESEWTQFLNAAGYPVSSTLPPSYRQPAATPLVAVAQPAPSAARAVAPASAAAAPVAPSVNAPDAGNPAGIRF